MRKEEIAGDIEALLDRWHESRSVGIAFMPDDWRTVIAALRASQSEADQPAAWIEHHKGGDNLVWDQTNLSCTPLYKRPGRSPGEGET
jgi:hypothetical protein